MQWDNKALLKNLNFSIASSKELAKYAQAQRVKILTAAPSERCKPPFIAYKRKVMRLTEATKHLVPGVEKRGFKAYHIDHKVSIWFGFKNGIPAEKIAHIDNLRMLTAKDNMLKGRKCVF